MDWKHYAIAPRRKAVATALMYGLSLTVRFTSPTAEQAQAQTAQSANPATSILLDHGWPGKTAVPSPCAAGHSAREAATQHVKAPR